MPPRPAYFDEDVLGPAKVVGGLRPDVPYPGDPGAVIHRRVRPPCEIPAGSNDPQWIPAVSERGRLVVTRDSASQRRPAEIAAVRGSGGRMVAVAGLEARGYWDQLEVLTTHWRRIEAWAQQPGPFVHSVTRTGTPRRSRWTDRARPDGRPSTGRIVGHWSRLRQPVRTGTGLWTSGGPERGDGPTAGRRWEGSPSGRWRRS